MKGREIKGTRQHLIFEDSKLFIGYELTELSSLKSWEVWKNIYKKSLRVQIANLIKKRLKRDQKVIKAYRMDLNLYESKTWFGYQYELFGKKTQYSIIWRKGKTPARYFISPYQFEIR